MNQRTATRTACATSLLFFFPLLLMAFRTMARYRLAADDWHYKAALAGCIVTVVMITLALVGILNTFRITRE